MKTFRAFLIAFAVGLAASFAPSCGQSAANCNGSNCSGCCAPNGSCQPGTSVQACGARGSYCVLCSGAETCSAGVCGVTGTGTDAGADAGSCDSTNCSGCCANGQCMTPSDSACGQNGSACEACSGAQHCTNGACVAPGCTGCVVQGACVTGTGDSACGSGGNTCVDCTQTGAHCSGQQCTGGTCAGCVNAQGCQLGNTSAACGTGGAICSVCGSGQSCVNNACQNNQGNCQSGNPCQSHPYAICSTYDACTATVCQHDAHCCTTQWDSSCQAEAYNTYCPAECGNPGADGGYNLSCSTPDTYNSCSGCGSERWDVKTGIDPLVNQVNMNPVQITVDALTKLPTVVPGTSDPRGGPTGSWAPEFQTYYLKDVLLSVFKSETDSDYHIGVKDPTTGATMITEIPCPACVGQGSPLSCLITHARHNGDGNPPTNTLVSIIGVGFYDPPHGQTDASPNNLELHPIIAFCQGQGCVPTAN